MKIQADSEKFSVNLKFSILRGFNKWSSATPPYLTGKFVIASLERSDAAQDDATYSISLENDGEVTFDETGLTEEAPTV